MNTARPNTTHTHDLDDWLASFTDYVLENRNLPVWLISDWRQELAELQQIVLCLAHAFKDDRSSIAVSERIRASLNAAWHAAANLATQNRLPET